jgi:uncharacterized membrane protein YbhN (UPF0104 family)
VSTSSGPIGQPATLLRFTATQRFALWSSAALYVAGAAALYAFLDPAVLTMVFGLPLTLFAALLGLSLVNYAMRAWRWVALGNHLGIRVPLWSNVLYYLAGYCLTSTPGKAGEAVRLWFLKSGHDVPYARSLPLMLADRIIDMWAVLILSMLSFTAFAAYAWQGAALAGLIVAVSIPILFPRRLEPLLNTAYGWMPRRGRLLVRARRTARSMAELTSWRSYGLTLLPTMGGWLAECVALYLLLQHLGAQVSLMNAVFVFSFSVIVGAVSMLPGGLGSTEATMVILLTAVGVNLDVALAATAIIRITTFWFAVGIGSALLPAAIHACARGGRQLAAHGSGAA